MLIHGKQIKGNTVGPEQVKKGEDVIYDLEGAKITGLGSPINLSDAATKEYVDALGNSNNYCQPVDILIKTSMSNAGSQTIGTRALCINANTPGVYEYTTSGWKIASDWQTIAVTPFATLVPVRATGTVYVAGRKENESIKFTELPQNVLAYSFDDYFKTTSYDGGISVSINPQKIASMAVIQELVTTINSKQDKLTALNAGDGIKIQNGKISMKLFDNGDPGWAIMQDGSFRLKYASENQSGIISAEDYIRIREASRSNQADWNENIDWTGSYVNNRTHYIEPKALYDSNVTIGSVSTRAIDISTSVEPNEIQVGHNISLVTSEFGVMKSTIAEEEIQSGGLLLTVYRAYFDNNVYVEFKNDFTEMEIYNGNAYSINYISSYDSDIYTVKKLDPMFLPEISVIDLASGSPSDLLHEYALIREDGVQLGVTIEVPKDKVIESAETGKVTQEDKEPGGIFYGNDDFQVGDIYIDLTIYVGGSPSIDHVYINVSKMNIGLYQGSENITVSEPDEHGVKTISLNDDIFLNGVAEAKDFIIPGSPETSLSQVADDLYSLNIKNGSSEGSLRQVSSAEEGEDYTIGRNASVFGEGTRATGVGAFAEGKDTLASGNYSHAEGSRNTVDRVINFTYVDGEDYYLSDANVNKGDVIDLNGSKIRVIDYVYNYQQGTRKVTFDPTHPEYQDFSGAIANGEARGQYSHSEGVNTFALGEGSHAEGNKTIASGRFSHAEGESTFAEFGGAHAEGYLSKAHGYNSHAEGNGTLADANSSHAEGTGSEARGDSSHAEGYKTTASGQESHAEGYQTIADGSASHAEGDRTISNGHYSHTEGQSTIADGRSTHVFGEYNIQNPDSQDVRQRGKFVEIVGNGDSNARSNARTLDWQGNETLAGNLTVNGTTLTVNGQQIKPQVHSDWEEDDATSTAHILNRPAIRKGAGTNSIIEGDIENNIASGYASHAEGQSNTASNSYAHAEGNYTTASGYASHAEGQNNTASDSYAHAEGNYTTASGYASHAEGQNNTASNSYAHAEGNNTTASGYASHAEGQGSSDSATLTKVSNSSYTANGDYRKYKGTKFTYNSTEYEVTNVSYDVSTSKTTLNIYPSITSSGNISVYFVTGIAANSGSHAEGYGTISTGSYTHTEGQGSSATDTAAHAEGYNSFAGGYASHAEGNNTKALGSRSHAEGDYTESSGYASHAEGESTIASIDDAHAEGLSTIASGRAAHAHGQYTIANHASQTAIGEYNIVDPSVASASSRGNYIEIVGNGTADNARSNARTLDWNGNEVLAGNLTVNGTTLTVNGQQIEPQVQSDWNQTTTTAKDYIKNKPENLSDFNNDEGFIDNTVNNLTNYYDKVQVDQMISSVSHLKIQVVDELPQDPDTDTIYLLPVSGSPSEDNVYEEYIYIMIGSPAEGHWEMIGTAQVDLEGYMQTSMNLSDVDSRQAALNNLTHSSQQDAGKILTIDVNGDAVLSDELSKYTKKSNNLNDVANRQTALNNLTGASSANSGKIMYVDASGDMTLTDRYETAAGMSANELSTHDSRLTSGQISNDYLLIMAMALKNSECKFGINFTIESVDGMSSNAKIVYHFDYFFMKSNQNQFAKLACIHGYSSNESVINQDNAIAITIETEPFYDVVSGVTSTTLPVLKIYRKKVNSAYDNCSYIIHELSKYNPFDGPSDWGLGYCCPKYYVGGNWYAQLKEYEVIATSSDSATTAQIESASEHYFPERTNMFISDMQALTQQEIENILV